MSASSRDRLQRVVAASSAVGPMTPPNPVVGAIESADTPAPAPLESAMPAPVSPPPVQLVPDTAVDRPVETARTPVSSARDEPPPPRARRENRGRAKQPANIYKADPRSGWTHTNARCKEDTKRLVQMLLAADPNRDISDLTESLFREWIAREAERLNIPQSALAKMVRTG